MSGILTAADFFWLVVLLLSLCIEASTAQLVSIWFAFGAAGAIIAARLAASGLMQMAVCLLIAAVLILTTRPLVRNLTRKNSVLDIISDFKNACLDILFFYSIGHSSN